MTAVRGDLDVGYRNVGAIIGGVLGLVAIGVLYAASSIPAVESILLVREVLSGDPFLSEQQVAPPMIVVPPAAAAAAGWLLAARAIAGDRWSGAAMGVVTYLVATVIGPIVAYGSAEDAQLFEVMAGAPFVSVFALFLLFPLLVACLLFGAAWASLLRSVAQLPPEMSNALPARPIPGVALSIGLAVLAVGWAFMAMLFGGTLSGGGVVD